jgi:uncharacterized protein (TIGR02001 family)
MKKLILATARTAAFAANLTYAQEKAPEAPVPEHALTYNVAVTSDYRFRGISQTRLQPALQGGADYTHNPSGFYVGTWLSSIKWVTDGGGSGNVEVDIYGGKRGDLMEGVTYDVGVLSYIYPSNNLKPSANTTEVYGQVGYGPAYVKYSHGVTNIFGFANSKNSGYLDLGANIDVAEGTQLNLHVGHQTVKNSGAFSYTDWKVGVTKDFGIVSGSLAAIGTNTSAYVGPGTSGKNLGKTGVVVAVSKTF